MLKTKLFNFSFFLSVFVADLMFVIVPKEKSPRNCIFFVKKIDIVINKINSEFDVDLRSDLNILNKMPLKRKKKPGNCLSTKSQAFRILYFFGAFFLKYSLSCEFSLKFWTFFFIYFLYKPFFSETILYP